MQTSLLRRILSMAVISLFVLVLLVVAVERARQRSQEPDMELEEALSVMGVTPASGQAPDVALESLSSKERTLSDFRGDVVFLNFWATWCAPCVEEMPAMQTLADEFADNGLTVVAVNVRENRQQVEEFVDRLGLEYTILLDTEGETTRDYNVRGFPTTVIIGRDGTVLGRKLGFHAWDEPQTMEAFAALLEQT